MYSSLGSSGPSSRSARPKKERKVSVVFRSAENGQVRAMFTWHRCGTSFRHASTCSPFSAAMEHCETLLNAACAALWRADIAGTVGEWGPCVHSVAGLQCQAVSHGFVHVWLCCTLMPGAVRDDSRVAKPMTMVLQSSAGGVRMVKTSIQKPPLRGTQTGSMMWRLWATTSWHQPRRTTLCGCGRQTRGAR